MSHEDEEVFGYPLSGDELRQMITSDAPTRFDYFIEMCRETGQVWTIGAEEDLIVLATDDDESFVAAFPHPEFGQDWCETTDLEDVDLVAVGVEAWTKEILPGLEDAGISILVLPTSEREGTLIGPLKLAESMK